MKSLLVKTASHFPLEEIVIKTVNIKHRPTVSLIRQTANKRGYRPSLVIIAQRDCRSLKSLSQYIFLVKSVHTLASFLFFRPDHIPHAPSLFAIEIKYKFSYFYTFAYIFKISRHPVISNLTHEGYNWSPDSLPYLYAPLSSD